MTFDFSPGAQIPITAAAPQTAATAALSSGAYRDTPFDDLAKLNENVTQKPGRFPWLAPDFGEAFCDAVLNRTTAVSRKPLVRSFGIDPRIVVEHCLEAQALRKQRDKRLTVVALIFGLLFLPGTLLWLGAFEFRRRTNGKQSAYGAAALVLVALIAALLIWHPFWNGFGGIYLRAMMIAPIVGWFIDERICLVTARQLRTRCGELIAGGAVGPVVPSAVPIGPEDAKAENLRKQLAALAAEQETNCLHEAGTRGILSLGQSWGNWELAEQLDPPQDVAEIRAFHPWDVIRKIEERLKLLTRSPLATGGMQSIKVEHWMIQDLGSGATEIKNPSGPEMDGSRMRLSAMAEAANKQRIGASGPRHYLGAQFVLHEGQLIVTLLIYVSAAGQTLRVSVHGYALGPLAKSFTGGPRSLEVKQPVQGKPWKETTKNLPMVKRTEVVRLAVRAPFTSTPDILSWLGGTLKLPEPFGLRSAWATSPWGNRSYREDAMNASAPVLRAVHQATLEFLAEHDVETDRFKNRSLMLSAEIQSAKPPKDDA